ncbi:Ubiquitin-conjugating enzyme E2C-binding protein [Forsythia ovata]|uniref:Ubiquitin-conjugating enzyme E2C-binding protein n=1 Tax=Forsythia ovata TaxID=205694 RepID=A0ABD1WT04_9LAMI
MSSPSSEKPPIPAIQNPRKWHFTWEAQSHSSTLRLLLFNPNAICSTQFTNLKADLFAQQSLLIVSYFEAEAQIEVSLRVPIPRILIDAESPVHFKAFDDHIEVKLVLLLPPDHPLVSDFDSLLDSSKNGLFSNECCPLSLDSDIKKLSAMQEVHFYCRNCSTKLTKDIRIFEEMPSVNWREVADNWFGTCCCSFGGVSEKLVTRYAESYTCAPGVVLLSATSILLCKDDLLGCEFPDVMARQNYDSGLNSTSDSCLSRSALEDEGREGQTVCSENHEKGTNGSHTDVNNLCAGENNLAANQESEGLKLGAAADCLSCTFHTLHTETNKGSINKICTDSEIHIGNCDSQCCSLDRSETSSEEQTFGTNVELLENQKVFLNGHLGSGFMERSSSLSQDIQWIEFSCPQCSCFIGAYPCFKDNVPLDGGVRLFKCYISTCLPVSGSNDIFRNYTLERMFTSQLLECANDELSFRTIVRNLQTKSSVLQIVLLNPNSWCCMGYCLHPLESVAKIVLHPTVKVLHGNEFDARMLEDWVRKNQADEVYMFPSQIKELITILDRANSLSPPSYTRLQGLFLSSLRR